MDIDYIGKAFDESAHLLIPQKDNYILYRIWIALCTVTPALLGLLAIAKVAEYWDQRSLQREGRTLRTTRTSLHRYPKLRALLQCGLMWIVVPIVLIGVLGTASLISNQSPKSILNDAEGVLNDAGHLIEWNWNQWISYIFKGLFIFIKMTAFVTLMPSIIGLLFPTLGISSTKEEKHYDDRTLIVFRWVTRGTSPDLIRTNMFKNWKILKHYNNVTMEVVTDKAIGVNPRQLGIPSQCFDEIVVPNTFRPPNGSKFKARALYYASVHSKLASRGSYIFHCDEESMVTDQLVIGAKEFVTNNYGKIGQGLITYRNDEYSLSSYLCHLADVVRPADDVGRFRFELAIIGKAVFGLKGSFVLVPNDIETNHATSFDCCGENGCIVEDSWWAFTQNMNNNEFAWCNGTLIEQSPFSLNDLRKQRKRWYSGLVGVILEHPAPWWSKSILFVQTMGWSLLPLLTIIQFLDLIIFGADSVMERGWIMGLNVVNGILCAVLYTVGMVLMVHKNYIEKVICLLLLIPLLPVLGLMESSGILSGIFYPEKGFALVKKEGMGVQKSLALKEEGELERLLV